MNRYFCVLIVLLFLENSEAQIVILDSDSKHPISYATISFGNGNGLFADDEGLFVFTKKLYSDVDSLFITALGYKNLNVATTSLSKTLFLEPKIDELNEIVIKVKPKGKFKKEKLKAYLDDDYYKCWLPTIESEIAVFFDNKNNKVKKITSVYFPFALESKNWKKRKRSNADKRSFSTLFKVNFYENKDGFPGKVLTNENIVFRVTEQDGDLFELNVDDYDIFIPKSGIFVSLQVLGYTDKTGKLLPNKKYKEIKSKNGVVKIPTNFRPLLPFTDKIVEHNTFIKRIFLLGNKWVQFKKGNRFKSGLLNNGLYNYGMGLTFNTYKDE